MASARAAVLSAGVLGALALSACGSTTPADVRTAPSSSTSASPASPVPAAYRRACGHPGAVVQVQRTTDVIKHADCDLRGVIVYNPGVGVTVPDKPSGLTGNGDSASESWTLDVFVAPTLDVRVTSG